MADQKKVAQKLFEPPGMTMKRGQGESFQTLGGHAVGAVPLQRWITRSNESTETWMKASQLLAMTSSWFATGQHAAGYDPLVASSCVQL